MKKVLLTTTALVMTAGVASAEITFSGKGEAGVYRTAPTAAVVGGTGATEVEVTSVAGNKDAGEGQYTYVDGLLTFTAGTTPAAVAADITAALTAVDTALDTERTAYQADLAAAAADVTEATYNAAMDDATAHLAEIKRLEATKAKLKGATAAAKGATPKLKAYSGYDLNMGISGASDNGMTFAFTADMGAGHIADQDDDRAMDAQGAAVTNDQITIGYAGYTVEIGDDLIDDTYDDSQNGDVAISGSLGDLTFKLVTDMDDDVKAVAGGWVYTAPVAETGAKDATDATYARATLVERAAVAAVYNPTSYSLGYTMGNIAFSMAGTEHDDRGHAAAKFSLAYTVSDATTVTLESDNLGTYKDIAKVSLKQKLSDAMTITASIKDDKDHALNTNKNKAQSSDISIAYTAGALGATLATDEGSNWWVNAQYDLGGGAQAFTTFDHTEFLVAGVNFKF